MQSCISFPCLQLKSISPTAFLEKSNVDTDQIIPKQYLKSIKKTGLGPFLFDAWRFEDEGYLGKELKERVKKWELSQNIRIFLPIT